jgi:hypothetical protein
MKIEVNESVRSFVTEDSDEPALGGKIHTFSQNLLLNPCRFCDQMLVQKPQLVSVRLRAKHELKHYMCNFEQALLMECGLPFELPLSNR